MALKEEIASGVAKIAPPAAISAASKVAGLTLADWVMVVTVIYTLLQIAYLLDKWRHARWPRTQEDEA